MSGSHVTRTLFESAKWSAVLVVPVALCVFALFGLAGGIEGGGKLVFLVALAPILLIERITAGTDGATIWAVVAIAESAYFFLLVFLFRLLNLQRHFWRAGQYLKRLLGAKTDR